ncbi:MAG: 3-deoxy-manno-octulosonate cytidylyltransferase [Alphaproteobacteria bacterium]|nr:3-deoxy-manno-octulosonate cytidylyltransferase [Alphaproteobacteria bacterium]
MSTVIIIPARLASTRLPNKPVLLIAGKPMIVHVVERALEADIGPVLVACAERDIADAVQHTGATALLTNPNHPSGTDRIYEALQSYPAYTKVETVINLQGDLPTINPDHIRFTLRMLNEHPECDISTLAVAIPQHEAEDRQNPNIVKAVIRFNTADANNGKALYFTRASAPWGDGLLYHHIGIYGYRRASLERFVSLAPSPLEQRERLEQLRALENGMSIQVGIIDGVPLGVDTRADLEKAELLLS